MNYTKEQETAIHSRGKIIVSASAGSGKTFVMISHLVELILGGADIKRVLALTFTNKAATQMRDRLRSALIKKIGESEGEERARLKSQLASLPLAEIGTIHSFCGRLVRSNFFLAGVDPAFRIIGSDDAEGGALSARAAEEVFENAYREGNEEFLSLLSVYFRKKKDARLKTTVRELYGAVCGLCDYKTRLAEMGEEDGFERVVGDLYEVYRGKTEFLLKRVSELSPYFTDKRGVALTKELLERCECLLGAHDLFEMCERARLPIKIPNAPPKTKAQGEEYKRIVTLSKCSAAVKELYATLGEYASREEEYARYTDARHRAAALSKLTLAYDEAFSRLKREANALDYNDLEQFALQVLSNETARAEIAGKYDYVFVDEYQDVNPVQEKILSLVSGGDVFLVGDAKQAIYGFRGSSSRFFKQKEEEFGGALPLTSNFRSAPAVLHAVNRVFRPLFKERYADMTGGDFYGEHEGLVRFHLLEEEKIEKEPLSVYSVLRGTGRAEKSALAEKVVSLVEEEFGSTYYDVSEEDEKKREKKTEYGDIAVLVRKNTGDAERVVRALTERGIPVSASPKVNVCDFFEARLLIDWLSYLDNAEQDVPLVSAMLSAVGEFNEDELSKIRLRFPSPYSFREACAEYRTKMADGLAEKLKVFEKLVEELRDFAQGGTAAETMIQLLALGLEAQIAAKENGKQRLARVRRLLAEAEESGSVHEFLARLKASDYRVESAQGGGEGAVKVLTMHASKGLEYPVVILAGLHGNFHGAERDELMFTEKYGVAPRSYDLENKVVYDTVLRRAAALEQLKEETEQEENLLYVAMTRAKCRLHLIFKDTEEALSPEYAKRFSEIFDFTACASYFTNGDEVQKPPLERKALVYERGAEEYTALVSSLFEREYPYAESVSLPVKSSATELIRSFDDAEADEERATGGVFDTDTGIAYHAFLQYVRFGAPVKDELKRMEREGLLTSEQITFLNEKKLEEILSLPSVFALGAKRVWREQTFLVRLQADEIYPVSTTDDVLFQGAIDVLCETERGYRILDYKFSSHGDEYLKKKYAPQIKLYKKAAARVLKIDENKISACIVNVARCREIEM